MPYNGSGVYSMPSLPGSFNPPIVGQQGTPATWITLTNDFVNAWNACLLRDGTSTVTADIPMANHKITGLADGTAATDAAAFGQIASAITAALPPGSTIPYVGSTAPTGWILAWGTIGNAASAATNRANADTVTLLDRKSVV